jgi:Ca2+-binding RTX toxin-like protein
MRRRAVLILMTVVLGMLLLASGAALAKTIDGTKDDDDLVGAENEDIIGGKDGADYISGAEGDDELYGGAGNDTVVGREGNDRISGDSGSDRLFGNEGTDTRTPGTVKRTLWSAAPESTQPTPIRTTRLTRPGKTSSCLSERPQLTSRRGA